MYKLYRPSPLCRAYNLEKALDTPAKIYYKFEGNNTSGSHKLNSAIAQAYYAKGTGPQGLYHRDRCRSVGYCTLSEACAYFGLDLKVFMVQRSPHEQKPFPQGSCKPLTPECNAVSVQRPRQAALFWHDPTTGGSLGCAISEAVKWLHARGLPLCTRPAFQSGAAAPVHHRSGEQAGYGNAR